MKITASLLLGLLAAPLLSAPCRAEEKDAKGCQDHPVLNRIPNYWIQSNASEEGRAKNRRVELVKQ